MVSSLSDSSQQHSPHFYFHAIFISAYSAVRVKIYAYVNMLGRNDQLLTMYLPERKAIATSLQLLKANDSFGKGFHALIAHMLKAHVLNHLMTGRCPRKALQLRPKFHATFKGLKSSPRLY